MQLRNSLKNRKTMVSVPIFLLLVVLTASAEMVDGIAAVVEDEIITYSELEEFLAPHLLHIRKGSPEWARQVKIAKVRRELLEELIEGKLLLSEAKKEGIVVEDAEVEKHLRGIKEKFSSEKEFRLQLSEGNLTEERFKEGLREQILVKKLVDLKIGSQTKMPSEEQILEAFEKNKGSFVEPERVAIGQIMVKVKGEAKWLEARQRIEDIRAQLVKGEDFSALARKYSDGASRNKGGNLEFINRAELLPEFDKVVSTLKVGDISDIIKTEIGFHIVKLESRKEARQREFSEVRKEIESHLYRLNMQEALGRWVGELKEKAYIEIKDFMVPSPLEGEG